MTATCDVCGNATDHVVLKVYKASMINSRRPDGRIDANLYTHRANIGVCCVLKINSLIDWKPRRKRAPR